MQTKEIYNHIIETMTTKQYFKWHNNYFKGDLNYKSLFNTIKASTKSKKIISLCDEGLAMYQNEFVQDEPSHFWTKQG